MMKKFISVLLCICMLASLLMFSTSAVSNELRFGSDGKFTILHITDTQDDHYIAHGLVEFIEKSIELTDPDFIVVTGDIVENSRAGDISDDELLKEGVTVDGDYEATLENTKKAVAQIFAPLEKSGIPYAVTQGNNDYSSGVTNEDWMKIYSQYKGCITTDMSPDADGRIDTYFPVISSTSDEPAFGIWMLDNGKNYTEEQLEWFKNYEIGDIPSVAFEHIPIDDMGSLYEECHVWDEGALISGVKAYRLNDALAMGHAEGIIEPGTTTDQFTAWKDKGVVGAFFGHWHTSGYTGVWQGITLGLTYGCQFSKQGPYGVRTVTLDEKTGTITTDLYEYIDGEFTLQVDEPYAQYDNAVDEALAGVINFFKTLINALTYLLKF